MRRNYHWIILIAFVLLVFIPPLVRGYVYPSGDDPTSHLQVIKNIKETGHSSYSYLGQLIVAYPLSIFPNTVAAYTWFSYFVLALAGLSVYYILNNLINRTAGLLGIILTIFVFGGVLGQWYAGSIYNTINIVIILYAVNFSLNWFKEKRRHQLILAMGLYVLAWFFHPSGIYLTAIIPLVGLTYFISERKDIQFVIISLLTFCALMGAALLKLSIDPYRQVLDGMTFAAISLSAFLGVISSEFKILFYIRVLGVLFIIGLSSLSLYHWTFDYNSSFKPEDMKAISFLNSLPGEHFSCSPEVAPWIYEQFTDKTYEVGSLPYIQRSKAMTIRTSSDTKWYWWTGPIIVPSYDNAKIFPGKDLVYVSIYY